MINKINPTRRSESNILMNWMAIFHQLVVALVSLVQLVPNVQNCKRCNKLTPVVHQFAPGGVCVAANFHLVVHLFPAPGENCISNFHQVHPFSAPGGVLWGTHLLHLHTRHALCVLKTIYIYAAYALCLLEKINILHSKHCGRFFLQHKTVFESQYQAPVV